MKNLEYGMKLRGLFDLYGAMLTSRQREVFDMYYNLDESLGETAENLGIGRQSVADALRAAEKALLSAEECLGFYDKLNKVRTMRDGADAEARAALDAAIATLEGGRD